MIKYRKFYDDEFINVSDSGNRTFHPVVMVDPNGSEFDIKYSDDVVDIQDQIDSFKDSTDINLIVDRFTNGDLNAIGSIGVLDPEEKSVVDLTILPEDVHTLMGSTNSAIGFYESLPNDIKSKYPTADDFYDNFDWNSYMAAQPDNSVDSDVKGEVTE